MKFKSVHNEIFIFVSSKMLKVKNKHFKNWDGIICVCVCVGGGGGGGGF